VTIGDVTFDWVPTFAGRVRWPLGPARHRRTADAATRGTNREPAGHRRGENGSSSRSGRARWPARPAASTPRSSTRSSNALAARAAAGAQGRPRHVRGHRCRTQAAGLVQTPPATLATQQAAASVGQGLLMARYTAAFARHERTVGQVLLTADDVVRLRALPQTRRRTFEPSAGARCRADRQRERQPSRPRRSGSATTTGLPRWSRIWCAPTHSCCCPTSTACTTTTPRRVRADRVDPRRAASAKSAATPTVAHIRLGRGGRGCR